jgi:hypothetical protein
LGEVILLDILNFPRIPNQVAIFDAKPCRFDRGRLVRLKQFESRGGVGVIGDRIIKDRITVLAAS